MVADVGARLGARRSPRSAARCAALRDRRLALVLLPAPLLFLLFMGLQERYFGRWLLPVLPDRRACSRRRWARARARRRRARAARCAPLARRRSSRARCCAGRSSYACTSDRVLARPDTRNLARAWMLAQRAGRARRSWSSRSCRTRWAHGIRPRRPATPGGRALAQVHDRRADVDDAGGRCPAAHALVKVEDYERTLRPALLDYYGRSGYCWVVIGSTQYGRASRSRTRSRTRSRYYRALARARDGRRTRSALPRRRRAASRSTSTGSFDYYPLAYARPGPGDDRSTACTAAACSARAGGS